MNWTELINEALTIIEDNISNFDLSPDFISNKVNFSAAHFNRAFNVLTGFTVAEYIRNRRLFIAGNSLKHSDKSVLDVALECGYESPEAFSKAFKRFHKINPSETKYEKIVEFNPLKIKLTLVQEKELNPKIIDSNNIMLTGDCRLVCKDNCDDISLLWEKADKERILNKYYGVKGFKSLVGVYKNGEYSIKALCHGVDLQGEKIEGGKWAIFSCEGNLPDAIDHTWDNIYSSWIINNEYKVLDKPQLEVYYDTDSGYGCQIWIPIESWKNYYINTDK